MCRQMFARCLAAGVGMAGGRQLTPGVAYGTVVCHYSVQGRPPRGLYSERTTAPEGVLCWAPCASRGAA